ncbi:MAG: hypothetical protein ACI97K_000503 [Glaciecola sp.]|jgi:hypothetical protein
MAYLVNGHALPIVNKDTRKLQSKRLKKEACLIVFVMQKTNLKQTPTAPTHLDGLEPKGCISIEPTLFLLRD